MAMGIILRNSLEKYAKPDVRNALAGLRYDPEQDKRPSDRFGPCSDAEGVLRLPKTLRVRFISNEADVMELTSL